MVLESVGYRALHNMHRLSRCILCNSRHPPLRPTTHPVTLGIYSWSGI